jgi:hypothetical protein
MPSWWAISLALVGSAAALMDEKTRTGGELRRAMRDVPKELLEETMAVIADEGRIAREKSNIAVIGD